MEEKQKLALVQFGIDPDRIIHEQGRYWMTAEQLGKAFGYKEHRKGVMKLLERHRKELQPFASVVKLGTEAGMRETTVFDTDGQYRIALLANTSKAEKFRTFIVNMLKAIERKEFVHVSQVMKWREALIDLGISRFLTASKDMDQAKYKKMLRYRQMGLNQAETAKLLDVNRHTLGRIEAVSRAYDLPFLKAGKETAL